MREVGAGWLVSMVVRGVRAGLVSGFSSPAQRVVSGKLYRRQMSLFPPPSLVTSCQQRADVKLRASHACRQGRWRSRDPAFIRSHIATVSKARCSSLRASTDSWQPTRGNRRVATHRQAHPRGTARPDRRRIDERRVGLAHWRGRWQARWAIMELGTPLSPWID